MLGGAAVSAPHLQVLNVSSHLASYPLLLTDLMPEGGGCRTPSVEKKKPLLPFPCACGSLGRVSVSPRFGDDVLTSAFPFLAVSICCLPAHPPFQEISSRAPGAPYLEISCERKVGSGLGGKGVPCSVHKKQISFCCPGSPAHISSLTGSAAHLRVTSRCFHSPRGGREGTYLMGMGITASIGVGTDP